MDGNRHYSPNGETNAYQENESAERVSVKQLQHLVHLLDESDVSEIEVKCADKRMHLVLRKAQGYTQTEASNNQLVTPLAAGTEKAAAPIETKHTVTAHLVGIFHRWAKPKTAPLINIGDRVKAGQLLGTIQSLNVINEVESLVAGQVIELLVQDGQPVEYGQPLMIVDSSEEA